MILLTIERLHKGVIIKRPSAHIKTPYVADVTIENIEFLAHTPSLGCCGLADKGAEVLMEKTEKTKSKIFIIIVLQNIFFFQSFFDPCPWYSCFYLVLEPFSV